MGHSGQTLLYKTKGLVADYVIVCLMLAHLLAGVNSPQSAFGATGFLITRIT